GLALAAALGTALTGALGTAFAALAGFLGAAFFSAAFAGADFAFAIGPSVAGSYRNIRYLQIFIAAVTAVSGIGVHFFVGIRRVYRLFDLSGGPLLQRGGVDPRAPPRHRQGSRRAHRTRPSGRGDPGRRRQPRQDAAAAQGGHHHPLLRARHPLRPKL